MAGRDAGVRVEGLREYKRDLKLVSPVFARELDKEIRVHVGRVAADARAAAAQRSGGYARSIKVYAAKGGAAVGSRLPQAGVLHWGGSIRPRGVPITFERRAVVYDAAKRRERDLLEGVGDALESAARKAGWR